VDARWPARLYCGQQPCGADLEGTTDERTPAHGRRHPREDGLSRITIPVSAAVVAVAAAGVGFTASEVSGLTLGVSVALLIVATGGTAFVFSPWCRSGPAAVLAFTVAGGAGAALAALMPSSPAFVITFLALLRQIAAGLSNSEIAAALFVSEATVKTHINHIFTKTGLRDRAQLVRYAFRHGLAQPG
jgi:DNA-binding CsgD family transcriptional regulator